MALLDLTFACFEICFLIVVRYFAGAVGAWWSCSPQYTNILGWLTGGILVSLSMRLAFTE
jgi:hypothetical protein